MSRTRNSSTNTRNPSACNQLLVQSRVRSTIPQAQGALVSVAAVVVNVDVRTALHHAVSCIGVKVLAHHSHKLWRPIPCELDLWDTRRQARGWLRLAERCDARVPSGSRTNPMIARRWVACRYQLPIGPCERARWFLDAARLCLVVEIDHARRGRDIIHGTTSEPMLRAARCE